jgi:hypothetical protein
MTDCGVFVFFGKNVNKLEEMKCVTIKAEQEKTHFNYKENDEVLND